MHEDLQRLAVTTLPPSRHYSDALRAEEDRHGIRVTSIYPTGTATDLLERVRAAFGRLYDPAACIQPATLAAFVVMALECPADAHVTELSVQPAPSGANA